mmetsp:Transcript_12183/g.30867  ORF Transcript_12183/g.30867 Transcript_12183/m.30867 type:complete len:561 (+) Transcript_12183:587-2269(+)
MLAKVGEVLAAQALVGSDQETADQRPGLVADGRIDRPLEGVAVVLDVVPDGLRVVHAEGRVAVEHLVEDAAETPPVAAERVALVAQDLHGHVGRGADACVGTLARPTARELAVGLLPAAAGRPALRHRLLLDGLGEGVALHLQTVFAETKVAQLEVAGAVEQKVLRLEVAVDVAQPVQLAHAHDHLGHVEAGVHLAQTAHVVEQRPEVAARQVLHGQVQVALGLEAVDERHQPVAVGAGHHVALVADVVALVLLLQNLLVHPLQRQHLARVPLLTEVHLAKAAAADLRQHHKVGQRGAHAPLAQKVRLQLSVLLAQSAQLVTAHVQRLEVPLKVRLPLSARRQIAHQVPVVVCDEALGRLHRAHRVAGRRQTGRRALLGRSAQTRHQVRRAGHRHQRRLAAIGHTVAAQRPRQGADRRVRRRRAGLIAEHHAQSDRLLRLSGRKEVARCRQPLVDQQRFRAFLTDDLAGTETANKLGQTHIVHHGVTTPDVNLQQLLSTGLQLEAQRFFVGPGRTLGVGSHRGLLHCGAYREHHVRIGRYGHHAEELRLGQIDHLDATHL